MTTTPATTSAATHSAPPGPTLASLLWNVVRGRGSDVLEAVTLWQATFGDRVYVPIPGRPTYIFYHPDAIGEFLVAQSAAFTKNWMLRGHKEVFGEGLLTSEGDFWRGQRKMMQPSFHHRRLQLYGAVMADRAQALCARLRAGETLDLQRELNAVALDIVVRSLFALEGGPELDRTAAALDVVLAHFRFHISPAAPPFWFPHPVRMRYLRAIAALDEVVAGLLAERRKSGRMGDDLLSTLLEARDEAGRPMSDRQLRDEVLTLLLAGHETTGQTLAFACDLLARHPEAVARLRVELDSVLGVRAPAPDDLAKLPFTDAIVKESLRLYPPAATIGREPLHDVTIAGVQIPAGSDVAAPSWVVHRDPRWYQLPLEFLPERWLSKDGELPLEQRLPKHAFFPFGGGPRVCIGNAFAMMEAKLVLATLWQRWGFELVSRGPLEVQASLTIRARGGIHARVVERSRTTDKSL